MCIRDRFEDFDVATSLEPQQIAALWPGSRRLSVKVRTVIDFFVEKFGPEPYWDRRPAP